MKLTLQLALLWCLVSTDPVQDNFEAAGDLVHLRQDVFPSTPQSRVPPPPPMNRIPPPPPPPPVSLPPPPPPLSQMEQSYAPDGRDDLLGQIREGKKLKAAGKAEKPVSSTQNSIQSALANRRKYLVDTESDDDDDWSD
ncbi:hypothetical protein PSACC_02882 [Paramicrosporidium saccamoebae]|uniref:WH2 domain-containing protein n=1 Tax=Paramicrosporidium saccamoebae TaxID=1246581 RepID=A0A2H9TI13_9FUNG|nr:hypothetical protein PSACC_02882 [Paramicrosporidium saccamoebae]